MSLVNRFVALSLVLTFTVSTQAQDKPKAPASPTASGTVKAIDAKSITIEGKKNKAGEVQPDATYALTADVKVMAGKEATAKLADVKVGVNVYVVLSDDSKSTTTIYLAGEKKPVADKVKVPSANGKIKAIDAKSITLEGQKTKGGEVSPDATYALATDIKVMLGKQAAGTIADVKVGLNVYLMLSTDSKTVNTIYIASEKKPDAEKVKVPSANGTVKTIDAKSITLEGKKNKTGEALPEATYAIATDVKVTVGKELKAIADVKTGVNVYLMLSPDMKTVTAITVIMKGDGEKPGVKPEKPGAKPVEKPGEKKPETKPVEK